MIAGLNTRWKVLRINYADDDYVGGAVITGTCLYTQVQASLQFTPTTQVFLEQGLETTKIARLLVSPGTLDIRERDELILTAPKDHEECNNYFRVVGVRRNHNSRDPRNYKILELSRSIRAHDNLADM